MQGNDDKHFMASVKIGPKGQIVIPKEARDLFALQPGDTLVLLADRDRGIALQRLEKIEPMLQAMFHAMTAPKETK